MARKKHTSGAESSLASGLERRVRPREASASVRARPARAAIPHANHNERRDAVDG